MLLLAAGARARAEEGLPEVLVTGPAEREPAPARDPTAFATVIDTRQAATTVETLSDALGELAGVQVRRFGGLGDFSTVSIRGFSSGQVQVYLDGVPLSRADNETVNLSDLPIDAIDHVEVYRGVTPLGFAQSGPGGVVNVVPRRPGPEPLNAASVSYGSFATRKVDVARAATAGAWDYLAFGHYLGSAGDFTYLDDRGTLNTTGDDQIRRRQNNAFNLGDFTGRVGWRPSESLGITLTNDTFAKEQGLPGSPPLTTRTASLSLLRQLVHLAADLAPPGVPVTAQAGAWFAYDRDQVSNPDGQGGMPAADTDDRTQVAGGQLLVRGAIGAHQVPGLFLALGHEQFASRDALVDPPDAPDRTRLRLTIAGEDEVLLFGDRLSVVPSLRWEAFRDDFPGETSGPGPSEAGGTQTHNYLSPRLGVRADAPLGFTLLGNASRAVRPPNLSELFGNRGFVHGNPNLDAEKAVSWDVGFRRRIPDQGTWLRLASVEYAYFDSHIDDLIQLIITSPGVAVPQNIGRARIRGHEVNLRLRLWDRVGLIANYTHQDARDESDDRTYRGKQLPGRPGEEAFVHVEFAWSPEYPLPLRVLTRAWPGQVFFELNYVGDDYLSRFNAPSDHVDSRLLYGAGLRLSLPWVGWQVAFEGRNLSDDHTEDVLGFPVPGRSWFGSIAYGFGS